MVALGFGVFYIGYSLAYFGWTKIKGYDLTLSQVISPAGYYKGTWPPATIGGGGGPVNPAAQAADKTAKNQGRPDPGSVQSRL